MKLKGEWNNQADVPREKHRVKSGRQLEKMVMEASFSQLPLLQTIDSGQMKGEAY